MLQIKNTITELKNTFYGLINRMDMVQKKISELENISIETSPTEIQKELLKKKKERPECPRTVGRF